MTKNFVDWTKPPISNEGYSIEFVNRTSEKACMRYLEHSQKYDKVKHQVYDCVFDDTASLQNVFKNTSA